MKKEKVLIIDDQLLNNRIDHYLHQLNNFDVDYCNNVNEIIPKLTSFDAEIILIDVVFDGWFWEDGKPVHVLKILELVNIYKPNTPIVLVSNQYSTLIVDNQLTNIMNEILSNKYNVVNFIVWSEFVVNSTQQSSMNYISNKLKLEIYKFREVQILKTSQNAQIGIIAALNEELAPLLDNFNKDKFTHEDVGNIRFTRVDIETKINKQKITLVLAKQDRMGNVDTAFIASIMRMKFNIKHLFMIGVCGGRESQNIRIGDILMPNESCAFQNGKLTEAGLKVDATSSQRNSPIQQVIDSDIEEFINKKYKKILKDRVQIANPLRILPPRIWFDALACGDVVIDKPGELDEIAARLSKRKLVGVDMESYSIFRANQIFPELKTTVIKSVMDITSDKSDQYKEFAATIASDCLMYILLNEKYLIE